MSETISNTELLIVLGEAVSKDGAKAKSVSQYAILTILSHPLWPLIFSADGRDSRASKRSTPAPGTPQSVGSSDEFSGDQASDTEQKGLESMGNCPSLENLPGLIEVSLASCLEQLQH